MSSHLSEVKVRAYDISTIKCSQTFFPQNHFCAEAVGILIETQFLKYQYLPDKRCWIPDIVVKVTEQKGAVNLRGNIWSFSFWDKIAYSKNGKYYYKQSLYIKFISSQLQQDDVVALWFFLRDNTFENCGFTRIDQQLQVDLTVTSAGCLYDLISAEFSNEGKPV